MKILERAAQVLQEESKAVLDLIETLDHRFEAAVELILASKGRVVCTGMGKSGHIARKNFGYISEYRYTCIIFTPW